VLAIAAASTSPPTHSRPSDLGKPSTETPGLALHHREAVAVLESADQTILRGSARSTIMRFSRRRCNREPGRLISSRFGAAGPST
jgi:hypothetical protein